MKYLKFETWLDIILPNQTLNLITSLLSNAAGWLCKGAMKVSIKLAGRSVPWAHGRKTITT